MLSEAQRLSGVESSNLCCNVMAFLKCMVIVPTKDQVSIMSILGTILMKLYLTEGHAYQICIAK